jgi:hypothetical protein
MATASGSETGPSVMAVLSMSDMAGASTWLVRAAKLVRSISVSPGLAGLGLDRSPIRKPSAPMELMVWRASGTSMLRRESVKEDLSRARAAPMASLSWRATPRLCSMVPKA